MPKLFLLFVVCCVFWLVQGQDDPIPQKQIQTFIIDLDKEPEYRWTEAVTKRSPEIHTLLNILKAGQPPRNY
jgi:hypothetical protein